MKIEPENLHTWLTPRIAQWQSDGQGKIVDAYKEPVEPLPYVAYGETRYEPVLHRQGSGYREAERLTGGAAGR